MSRAPLTRLSDASVYCSAGAALCGMLLGVAVTDRVARPSVGPSRLG